jgi:hypothetical protein
LTYNSNVLKNKYEDMLLMGQEVRIFWMVIIQNIGLVENQFAKKKSFCQKKWLYALR